MWKDNSKHCKYLGEPIIMELPCTTVKSIALSWLAVIFLSTALQVEPQSGGERWHLASGRWAGTDASIVNKARRPPVGCGGRACSPP